MQETRKVGLEGICLDNDVARAIWRGNTRYIPLQDSIKGRIDMPMYLCASDMCYGVIKLNHYNEDTVKVDWVVKFELAKYIDLSDIENNVAGSVNLLDDGGKTKVRLYFEGTNGTGGAVTTQDHKNETAFSIESCGVRLSFDPRGDMSRSSEASFFTNERRLYNADNIESSKYFSFISTEFKNNNDVSNIVKLEDKDTIQIPPFKVTTYEVLHEKGSKTASYCIDVYGLRVLYSPYLAFYKHKQSLSSVDILVGDGNSRIQSNVENVDNKNQGHLSIEKQMEITRRESIPTLILTNFGETLLSNGGEMMSKNLEESRKRKNPNLNLIVPKDDMVYEINTSSIELISDIKTYDASQANNKVLADDARIALAWYSKSVSDEDSIKFTTKEILAVLNDIYSEIYSRVFNNKMNYSINKSKMSPPSKEAIDILSKDIPREIDYLEKEADKPDKENKNYGEILSKYANVRPSNKSEDKDPKDPSKQITVDSVMDSWSKPILLRKNFISVVGGVPNHGKSISDLDVLIRKNKPHGNEDVPLKFRLYRALPRHIGDNIHWRYDQEHFGPFTNHYPMYDLALVPSDRKLVEMSDISDISEDSDVSLTSSPQETHTELQRVSSKKVRKEAENSKKEDKIEPHRFFLFPKPMHGRDKDEIYTIDSVIETMNEEDPWEKWKDTGVVIEKKFDGVTVELHKTKNKVTIYTDDGGDVTNKLPSLVRSLRKIDDDFVILGEAELYEDSEPKPRAETSGVLHAKDSDKEKDVRVTIFDCVWVNGKDIHNEPFHKRVDYLGKIKAPTNNVGLVYRGYVTDNIYLSKRNIADTEDEVREYVEYFRSQEGSEGAVLKLRGFKFELDGTARTTLKFKNELILNCKVAGRHLVKGTDDTYFYYVSLRDGTPVGKTFNVKLSNPAEVGDIIKVVFVDVSKYKDPKTKEIYYRMWSPRVIGRAKGKADTTTIANKFVKETTGGDIEEKRLPKDIREVYENSIEELSDPTMKLPDEDKKYQYVIQDHWRGESLHGDFRFEVNDKLAGWTLLYAKEGEVPDGWEPDSLPDARKMSDKIGTKFNWDKGKVIGDDKLVAVKKRFEPSEWLHIEKSFDKGTVGATKNKRGAMVIRDEGTIEFGAQKSHFHEYFLHGKKINGILILRRLPNVWKYDIPSPKSFDLTSTYSEEHTNKKDDKTGRSETVWFAWVEEDPTPYVISKRAVNKKWIPPYKHSVLPKSVRSSIPSKYKFWNKKGDSNRIECRDLLVEAIENEEVSIPKKLSEEVVVPSTEISLSAPTFSLQYQWWKRGKFVTDPETGKKEWVPVKVVRSGPSRKQWNLHISGDDKVSKFVMNANLIESTKTSAILKKSDKDQMKVGSEGEEYINPQTKLNPDKETSSFVEMLDGGPVTIYEDSPRFKKLGFKGKELDGVYIFELDKGSKLWKVSKSEKPGKNVD